MNNAYVYAAVAVVAVLTALTRFLPFLLFRGNRKTPAWVLRLGSRLPYAIMGMLVVYCLKDTALTSLGSLLPVLLACLAVTLLHLWRRNTLLSILGGTLTYMLLVQFVFV